MIYTMHIITCLIGAIEFNFLTEFNGTCPQLKCKACLPGYGYVKDVGGCQTCKCARKSKYSYLDLKFHE